MEWAKTRSQARFNLATSGVMDCSFEDLAAETSDLELRRPSGYAYEPLLHALSLKSGIAPESIVTTMGTSFAIHLAMAAVLSAGDEVLIEHPAYDPLLSVAEYLHASVKRFHR